MPASLSCRPGTAYLTIVPTTRKAAATPKTAQPVAEPSSIAQTRIADQDERASGQDRHEDADQPDGDRDAHEHFGQGHAAHLPTGPMAAGPDMKSGPGPDGPGPRNGLVSERSDLVEGCGGGRVGELVGLVHEVHGDLTELVSVLRAW